MIYDTTNRLARNNRVLVGLRYLYVLRAGFQVRVNRMAWPAGVRRYMDGMILEWRDIRFRCEGFLLLPYALWRELGKTAYIYLIPVQEA